MTQLVFKEVVNCREVVEKNLCKKSVLSLKCSKRDVVRPSPGFYKKCV